MYRGVVANDPHNPDRADETWNGLTQEDLSHALEITRGAVASMESGRQGIDCYRLVQLSQILGVHVGYFFGRPGPKFDPEQDLLRGVIEDEVMSGKVTQAVASEDAGQPSKRRWLNLGRGSRIPSMDNVTLIAPDGSQTPCDPTFEAIKAALDNAFIVPFRLPSGDIFMVDEDGFMKELPINMPATEIAAGQAIVGKAVFVPQALVMKILNG